MSKYANILSNVHLITNNADRFRSDFRIVFTSGGSWLEEDGEKGVTHLLEHCLVQRTKELDIKSLRKNLFKKSIYLNASTGVITMDIVTSGHRDDADEMLDMILEMAFEPTFSEEGLKQEKEIVLREIIQRKGDPNYRLGRLVNSEIYEKGSKSLYEVLGEYKDVENATVEVLERVHKRILSKSQVIITASGGNIKHEEIIKKIEKYSNYITSTQTEKVDFDIKNKLKKFKYHTIVSELAHEAATLTFGVPFKSTLENFPQRVLIYIMLMQPPHGALYERLRNDLGHVYHVEGGFDDNTDSFTISVNCEIQRIPLIIEETKKLLDSIDEVFTEEKLEIIRELTVKGQQLSKDNPQTIVDFIDTNLEGFGIVFDLEEFIKNLNSITLEDVREVFKEITNNWDKLQILAVSNNKEIKNLNFKLNLY